MRKDYKAYKKVGKIKETISENLKLSIPKTVYASPGVINHIKKRHGKQFTKKFKDNIIDIVERIIKNPDYVGFEYDRRNTQAIDLVKKIDNVIVLLGLEIDIEDEYIYVATMYPLTESKLSSRIYSGRLVKVDHIEIKENIL